MKTKQIKGIAPGSYKSIDELVAKRQQDRKRKAGKHKCQWKRSGSVSRVTSGDKILKRPVAQAYFYECKLCGEIKLVQRKRK